MRLIHAQLLATALIVAACGHASHSAPLQTEVRVVDLGALGVPGVIVTSELNGVTIDSAGTDSLGYTSVRVADGGVVTAWEPSPNHIFTAIADPAPAVPITLALEFFTAPAPPTLHIHLEYPPAPPPGIPAFVQTDASCAKGVTLFGSAADISISPETWKCSDAPGWNVSAAASDSTYQDGFLYADMGAVSFATTSVALVLAPVSRVSVPVLVLNTSMPNFISMASQSLSGTYVTLGPYALGTSAAVFMLPAIPSTRFIAYTENYEIENHGWAARARGTGPLTIDLTSLPPMPVHETATDANGRVAIEFDLVGDGFASWCEVEYFVEGVAGTVLFDPVRSSSPIFLPMPPRTFGISLSTAGQLSGVLCADVEGIDAVGEAWRRKAHLVDWTWEHFTELNALAPR